MEERSGVWDRALFKGRDRRIQYSILRRYYEIKFTNKKNAKFDATRKKVEERQEQQKEKVEDMQRKTEEKYRK